MDCLKGQCDRKHMKRGTNSANNLRGSFSEIKPSSIYSFSLILTFKVFFHFALSPQIVRTCIAVRNCEMANLVCMSTANDLTRYLRSKTVNMKNETRY